MAGAFFLTPRLTGLRSVFSLQTHPRSASPTVEAGVAAGVEPREVLSDGGRHPALSFIASPLAFCGVFFCTCSIHSISDRCPQMGGRLKMLPELPERRQQMLAETSGL